MTVFLLWRLYSDQYGTSKLCGVFATEAEAEAAKEPAMRKFDTLCWVSDPVIVGTIYEGREIA